MCRDKNAAFAVCRDKNAASVGAISRMPPVEYGQIITLIYLKVSLSDFLTLFSCRTQESFFWTIEPGKPLMAAVFVSLTISTFLSCSREGETSKRGKESVGEGDKGKKVTTTSHDSGGKSEREKSQSTGGEASPTKTREVPPTPYVIVGGKGLRRKGDVIHGASCSAACCCTTLQMQ